MGRYDVIKEKLKYKEQANVDIAIEDEPKKMISIYERNTDMFLTQNNDKVAEFDELYSSFEAYDEMKIVQKARLAIDTFEPIIFNMQSEIDYLYELLKKFTSDIKQLVEKIEAERKDFKNRMSFVERESLINPHELKVPHSNKYRSFETANLGREPVVEPDVRATNEREEEREEEKIDEEEIENTDEEQEEIEEDKDSEDKNFDEDREEQMKAKIFEQKRNAMFELWKEGYTSKEIAAKMGMTVPYVQRKMREIVAEERVKKRRGAR